MRRTLEERITLAGFMGAGKTTLAAALARQLSCRMIDLDELIVAHEGRSIRAIMDEDGEPQFREIETRALEHALAENLARIIALGGGTWTLERNRALIREHNCLTIWLDAPFELCWQRIVNSTTDDSRPLAREQEQARRLYVERQELYQLAMLRVEANGEVEAEALALKIINLSQSFL